MTERQTIGPFSLLAPLATGGVAEVWLAKRQDDLPEATPTVLKTILPHYANNPEFVSIFLNETQWATRLEHPNIVRVYEAGRADGCHYIAMEYVVGRTLRQILCRSTHFKKLFPVWFALDVAATVCDALEYLHELTDPVGFPLKLLHRNVTPENIMVSFTGEVKLLDFGITRALNLPSLTQAGTLKGKYAYMAPELIEVDRPVMDIDGRSDLYSLGVILYEALTGIRPYNTANDAQLLQIILDKNLIADPPSHFAPWIPDALDRLVLRAIAKDPADRFPSARCVREALRDFMRNSGLCPTSRHIAEQVCGYSDALTESRPPPSMRLQSPHEVALRLDSGCHKLCAQYAAPNFEFGPAETPSCFESQASVDKTHDWDAALRRVREEESALNCKPVKEPPPGIFNSGTYSIDKDAKQQAMNLFDQSLEQLRRHDVGAAIETLKRAAQLEPDNRLVSANLRRLEQLTLRGESAARRG